MNKKAKRVITEFDFEKEGASVHLVSKKQGGAANGFTTLIKKSKATEQLPDVEDVTIQKKLEQIKVTMSMEEFLRKFFNMYYDDAELLTAMLGFQTEYEAYMETEKEESEPYSHADYIASKLSGFEIMKSVHEGKYEDASALDIVTILELQENLENKLNEEMMDKISIEKSRFTELESKELDLTKALEDKQALEAQVEALEAELTVIKQAKVEADTAAMKARIEGLVAEDKIETMAKSLLAMDKESADLFVASLESAKNTKEESDLFVEKSAEGEPEVKTEQEEKDLALEKAYLESLGVKA